MASSQAIDSGTLKVTEFGGTKQLVWFTLTPESATDYIEMNQEKNGGYSAVDFSIATIMTGFDAGYSHVYATSSGSIILLTGKKADAATAADSWDVTIGVLAVCSK